MAATLGGLQGTNALSLLNTSSAAVALSVGNNGATTTYSGLLGGGGSLTKIGGGTLTLSGSTARRGGTRLGRDRRSGKTAPWARRQCRLAARAAVAGPGRV